MDLLTPSLELKYTPRLGEIKRSRPVPDQFAGVFSFCSEIPVGIVLLVWTIRSTVIWSISRESSKLLT